MSSDRIRFHRHQDLHHHQMNAGKTLAIHQMKETPHHDSIYQTTLISIYASVESNKIGFRTAINVKWLANWGELFIQANRRQKESHSLNKFV